MADIKLTLAFVKKLNLQACKHHKQDRVATKVEKALWVHTTGETKICYYIWCSSCGKMFTTKFDYDKAHGGE